MASPSRNAPATSSLSARAGLSPARTMTTEDSASARTRLSAGTSARASHARIIAAHDAITCVRESPCVRESASRRGGTMRTHHILFGIALMLATSVASSAQEPTDEEGAAAWFEAHRARPVMARMFLQRMPKGGDIHTHLSGAVYAESYIGWAADAKLCANTTTGAIVACGAPPSEARPVAEALRDPGFYSLIVDGLSTRNLANQPQSGHDQFFDAFSKFRAATRDRSADMVAELATRAADQHVTYLEIMLTLGGDALWTLAGGVRFDAGDFAASRQRLLDAGLAEAVKVGRAELDTLERQIDAVLGCGRAPSPPACRVGRRYLQQASRSSEPNMVFAQLVYGFELSRAERRVVGVNIVAPEDF